ncbi:MAG: DUF3343 domain-containing protein [Symbiobacteriaceae bacterium]|nr:DUF3343 domain-containing protein [Symbiobacteriaceae bacterium]
MAAPVISRPLGDRLVTFASTHQALRAEKILREARIAVELIPTPRHLNVACGLSLCLSESERECWLPLLTEAGLEYSMIVEYTGR